MYQPANLSEDDLWKKVLDLNTEKIIDRDYQTDRGKY
jgi:hypothetical protein